MYIALTIIFLIILILVIPIKITIDYEYYSKDYDVNNEDVKREFRIYILRFIKVKTIKKVKKEKSKNKKNKDNNVVYNILSVYKKYKQISKDENSIGNNELDKLKKNIKFQKIDLDVGYNTKNLILNSYLMAYLNYLINSYIAKNSDNFNLKNIKYNTYISKNLFKIRFKSIVNLNFVNTIYIILKLIIKNMKGGKNNGKKASNRRFNDNCYDIS